MSGRQDAKKFFREMDPEEREQLKLYMANMRSEEGQDSDENEVPGLMANTG